MARERTIARAIYSVLAPGARIVGIIYSEEDVRIDGSVEGDIKDIDLLYLKSSSQVKGDMKTATLIISQEPLIMAPMKYLNKFSHHPHFE